MGIADKLRKAREIKVEAGGFSFTVRRPTDLEMIELQGGQVRGDKLLRFLIDWDGVKEIDMMEGGDPHPLKFDPEIAREWLSDRPDLFAKITSGMIGAYQAHSAALEEKLKNSAPGSN